MNEAGRLIKDRLADERGQTLVFLVKIGLAAIVVALAFTQMGPILANQLRLHDTAGDLGDVAILEFKNSHGDLEQVKRAVEKGLMREDARLVGEIGSYKNESGQQVLSFTSRRTTRTFLFYNISFLARFTEAAATTTVAFDY